MAGTTFILLCLVKKTTEIVGLLPTDQGWGQMSSQWKQCCHSHTIITLVTLARQRVVTWITTSFVTSYCNIILHCINVRYIFIANGCSGLKALPSIASCWQGAACRNSGIFPHLLWNITTLSALRSPSSSFCPFSMTSGCLRTSSQPMWEKKKPRLALWGSASVSEYLWWTRWSLAHSYMSFFTLRKKSNYENHWQIHTEISDHQIHEGLHRARTFTEILMLQQIQCPSMSSMDNTKRLENHRLFPSW